MQQSFSAARRLSDFMHTIAPLSSDNRAFSAVLSDVLKIPKEDVLSLHEAYISLLKLFEEAILEGDSIENSEQKELFLSPIIFLQRQFQRQAIISPANSFQIGEPTLSRIKYAAEYITTNREQPISSDVLAELMLEAESLIEQVIESDLPKYLKNRLVEVLEELRFAIITYRLHGIKALRKATENMTGILVNNKAEIKETIESSEKSKKTIFDIATFISKTNDIVGLAIKLKELAEPVIQWLLPPGTQL